MPARSNYMLKGKNMQMAQGLAQAIFPSLIFLYSLRRYHLELDLEEALPNSRGQISDSHHGSTI